MKNKKCYFCGETATTREHVPPKGFFPKDKRKDLITVPSCKIHNNNKSWDDEYFRMMVIGSEWDELPANLKETIKRSINRKPKLAAAILRGKNSIRGESHTYDADVKRIYLVLESIGRGLLFYEYDKIYTSSVCIVPGNMDLIEKNRNYPTDKFKLAQELAKSLFSDESIKWKGSNSDIFCYKAKGNLVQFRFYENHINTVYFNK